jgi:hypothetical protein
MVSAPAGRANHVLRRFACVRTDDQDQPLNIYESLLWQESLDIPAAFSASMPASRRIERDGLMITLDERAADRSRR